MNFFKDHIRPALIGLLVILIPVVAISVIASLPPSDPPIPDYFKAQGFSAVRGADLEKQIAATTQLATGEYAIACPDVLVVSQSKPGLCGYCRISDMTVYPFWQEGFTAKLRPERYDYRAYYDGVLHHRFVLLTHGEYRPFKTSSALGQWNDSYGKWFYCKNSEYLDMNAYVEVFRDPKATNALKVRLAVGEYKTLNPVYNQISLPRPTASPTATN